MADTWVEDLLQPGRRLSPVTGAVHSVLPSDDRGSPYDTKAALYDRVVGSPLYNRLVWGASPAAYTDFTREAVSEGDGPLLDIGCGSAVFTADVYRSAARRLVLVDRSVGMLARAAQRLGEGAGQHPVAFVQADAFDLPFRSHSFPTVTCFGLLHLFDDAVSVFDALRSQLAPGGSLYATCLVADRLVGRRALAVLHRSGEAATPRRTGTLLGDARTVFGDSVRVHRTGSMAFMTAAAG